MKIFNHFNMKKHILSIFFLLSATTMLAQASENWKAGQLLTEAELSALGQLTSVQVGNESLRILTSNSKNTQGFPITWVIDARGRIGQTLHEVTVPQIPTENIQSISSVVGKAVSVKYYDNIPMTVLRYANLQDAAEAAQLIEKELRNAKASINISYSPLQLH